MEAQLFPLFSTPVMTFSKFITEEERLLLLKEISNIEHIEHGLIDNGAKSTHASNSKLVDRLMSKTKKLKQLRKKFNSALNEFSKIWGLGNLELTNSWSNQQTIGSKLKKHCHPNSKVSGALYLNVDEESSPLYFYNPNPYVEVDVFAVDTEFNWKGFWLQPQNCQLILFPSWLQHGSDDTVNNTENRTVLSINSELK